MIISTILAVTLMAAPPQEQPQMIEQPTCLVDRLEDNDQVVLEVYLDGEIYLVNVPAQEIAGEVYDDMALDVEIMDGYVVLNNVPEADFDVWF